MGGQELEVCQWEYKGKLIRLYPDDIYFICSEQRKTYVHTAERVYQIGTTVKLEAERLRSHPFVRTHQAYLVHLKYLECIGDSEAVLRNGERVPVSQRCQTEAKQQLRTYGRYENNAKKHAIRQKIRSFVPDA